MVKKKIDKMGVYPTEEFKKIVEAEAKKEGRSVSNYILNILNNHIDQLNDCLKVKEINFRGRR